VGRGKKRPYELPPGFFSYTSIYKRITLIAPHRRRAYAPFSYNIPTVAPMSKFLPSKDDS